MCAALPAKAWVVWETGIPVGYGGRRAISGLKKAAGSWLQRMGNKNENDVGIPAGVVLCVKRGIYQYLG